LLAAEVVDVLSVEEVEQEDLEHLLDAVQLMLHQ